ncbi:uncharacterized protein LACBIDRAFT_300233 [Laccaria bicolor S238N-H82]|uniref:Predicted protein n=1 Tax=Laccaria bicolor (strain S238N-H82 / ATCC MYA-4686) TaxID=486041 RepID=B0E3W0_LACBS|nr:uncharacterized protein LACBIDRAFT_300233 [Laccaria bicolor S238N-H82]EDQ98472.1 predicted protein [Laccaria bicolor S238N-H82]|eukprot:XP_001890877.1 predicted protein [Laccaria bicolor S238N-H82]
MLTTRDDADDTQRHTTLSPDHNDERRGGETTWQMCHVVQTVTTQAVVTVHARCHVAILRRGNDSTDDSPICDMTKRHNNNRTTPTGTRTVPPTRRESDPASANTPNEPQHNQPRPSAHKRQPEPDW